MLRRSAAETGKERYEFSINRRRVNYSDTDAYLDCDGKGRITDGRAYRLQVLFKPVRIKNFKRGHVIINYPFISHP